MAKTANALPLVDEHSEDTLALPMPRRLRPSERMDVDADRKIWEANLDLLNEQGRALVASSADR